MTRLWDVSVIVPGTCCLWEGFAADPTEAAELALERWRATVLRSPGGARAEVREVGGRRGRPVYVGWL